MGIFSKLKDLLPTGELVQEAGDAYEARIEAKTQESQRDAAWESQSIANSGWKDEYVLLLLSIPLVLAFVPHTQQIVLDGFAILDKTPEWYRWLVGLVFTAIYGIRVWKLK